MLKRLFKLSQDHDGSLAATLDTYSETGIRTSHEDVDVRTLPLALVADGAILGPVGGVNSEPLPDPSFASAVSDYSTENSYPSTLGEEITEDIAEDIAEGKAALSKTEEVEEPEPLKGKLPADFPGHKELDAAGVHTYGQLRKHVEAETLQEIPGIGKATAAKIVAALESDE